MRWVMPSMHLLGRLRVRHNDRRCFHRSEIGFDRGSLKSPSFTSCVIRLRTRCSGGNLESRRTNTGDTQGCELGIFTVWWSPAHDPWCSTCSLSFVKPWRRTLRNTSRNGRLTIVGRR